MAMRLGWLLMALSGFAGLGYQIVWTQQCTLWLGHEAASVLAVVTAFFGGLALGAGLLGARIERSAQPARWYAACELVVAAWSLALAVLVAPLGNALLALIGPSPSAAWHATVAFAGTLLVLLPATAAMGATLPAMQRMVTGLASAQPRGPGIGALYASNTFGALVGVLAVAFWLVPTVGLTRSAALCAVFNVACAAMAWVASRRAGAAMPAPVGGAAVDRRALAVLACTGLLGIGYEVLVVRVLSQVAEDTVYTYALLLAVYLVGTALGAAAEQRWARRGADAAARGRRLLALQSIACLIGTATLWAAPAIRDLAAQAAGEGMVGALVGEGALAVSAFLLPTLVMGAQFSHLLTQAHDKGTGLGPALAANTLGAAVAAPLIGVGLTVVLGPKGALLCVSAGYLLLLGRGVARAPVVWAPAAGVLALAVLAPPLAFVDVPPGGRVLGYRDGMLAAVSVVEDAQGVARLRINNRQQEGSSATGPADARQAWLPLLLHPAPRHVLFLGLGTGTTARAAAADPSLRVDAVELLPEVIEASSHFSPPEAASHLNVMAADARRYVHTATRRYDVIVSDNFHPARSGSGALYTVEHFRAVRERLAAGGLFCQWLPLHQLDLATLRSIVGSFVEVYPQAGALLATNSLETPVLGLVSYADDGRFPLAALRMRLASAGRFATALQLDDEYALLGSLVAGPAALGRFAAGAPLNTDDRPVVAYRAPRITYAPDSLPRDRLLALLREVSVAPHELVDADGDVQREQRIARYRLARDRFLEAGRAVRPSADVRRMLAQVQQPLLGVLRLSPDFRPAYDPLLRMAAALAPADPAAARGLMEQLDQVHPAGPEAQALLAGLDAASR